MNIFCDESPVRPSTARFARSWRRPPRYGSTHSADHSYRPPEEEQRLHGAGFHRLFSIYVKKLKISFFVNLGKSRQNLGKTVEYDKMDVIFVISDLDYPLLGIFRKNKFFDPKKWKMLKEGSFADRVPPCFYALLFLKNNASRHFFFPAFRSLWLTFCS